MQEAELHNMERPVGRRSCGGGSKRIWLCNIECLHSRNLYTYMSMYTHAHIYLEEENIRGCFLNSEFIFNLGYPLHVVIFSHGAMHYSQTCR